MCVYDYIYIYEPIYMRTKTLQSLQQMLLKKIVISSRAMKNSCPYNTQKNQLKMVKMHETMT